MAPQVRALVSIDALRAGWDSEISRHGRVVSIGAPVSDPARGGAVTVRIPLTCERSAFTLLVTITDADLLAGLQIAPISASAPVPEWQPPEYVASLNPETEAASEPAIAKLAGQAELVDSSELSASTAAGELPFGLPAAYWLDLRSYQPERVAAEIDRPLLILQGGRDYQVTIAEDLHCWQRTLAARPDVTIHVCDADNHCFFLGAGPSTPAEYDAAQHVDPRVISDIAAWLTFTTVRTPQPLRSGDGCS